MHLSRSFAVLLFEALEQPVSLHIYEKYNWQRATVEVAICTGRVEGHGIGPRALLHALHHYTLQAKILLVDFNLTVFQAKLPNRQINSPSGYTVSSLCTS